MWERSDEPLLLDEIAQTANLSKFYFSRLFRRVTGTSPGRFLSAIRLHKAKRILQDTDFSIMEISYMVGYNSLGTFTTRFARSVGVTPGQFRQLAVEGCRWVGTQPRAATVNDPTQIVGTLVVPAVAVPIRIYIGAFSGPLVEGVPAACDIVDCPAGETSLRRFDLRGLPPGTWHIQAAAVPRDQAPANDESFRNRALLVGDIRQSTDGSSRRIFAGEPLKVDGKTYLEVEIGMREVEAADLPILLALPELDASPNAHTGTLRRGRFA